ncbi:type II secretion system F family protein [Candidatus Peregrinibacteria bacterium]|jgi:type IV pilus assembly protein PilC|nr:type II secretion system F family protein [Candidatus Peregrinibacteria bacterium]
MEQKITNNSEENKEEVLFEIGKSGGTVKRQSFDEDLNIEVTGNFLIDTYKRLDAWMQSFTKIKMKEKMTFFQLLSVTLNAGVPLIKALRTIAGEFDNVKLRKVTLGLASRIEKGKKLSQSMEDYPHVFTNSQIGMVNAGEVSGKLNDIFEKINRETEKNTKLAAQIKAAMIYPIIVLIILGVVITLMMVMVIPKIGKIFTEAGMDLPPITRWLIAFSTFVQAQWLIVLIALVAAVFILRFAKKTPLGRWYFDSMLLRLPVMGKLFRMIALAKFARTLSALISSGISIVKALQIDAEAVGNDVYKKRILIAADDVAKGIPLGENLAGNKLLFPSLVVSMVAVGEQSAELASVMDKIADYYDNEVEAITQNIAKLMEPFILVILGGSVGLLVTAIMQPIMSLTNLAEAL